MNRVRKPNVHELRAAQRFPTNLPATLHVSHWRHSAVISDISARGARIRCAASLPLRQSVTLETHDQNIDAEVMWRSGQSYGLQFERPVAPLEIVRQNHPRLRAIFGAAPPTTRTSAS